MERSRKGEVYGFLRGSGEGFSFKRDEGREGGREDVSFFLSRLYNRNQITYILVPTQREKENLSIHPAL